MAIKLATSRQALADKYVTLGTFYGLCTGSPGTTSTPANETSGGSYARQATVWSAGSGGVQNGSAVTINAKDGTYTHTPLCSSATGNNMVDWAAIVSTVLSAPGQIVLSPTYTQT